MAVDDPWEKWARVMFSDYRIGRFFLSIQWSEHWSSVKSCHQSSVSTWLMISSKQCTPFVVFSSCSFYFIFSWFFFFLNRLDTSKHKRGKKPSRVGVHRQNLGNIFLIFWLYKYYDVMLSFPKTSVNSSCYALWSTGHCKVLFKMPDKSYYILLCSPIPTRQTVLLPFPQTAFMPLFVINTNFIICN